jgi:adenylosuccinate synthase
MINGITALAVNHVDTIGKLEKIKLCTAYSHDGVEDMRYSTNSEYVAKCKPVYEEFEGNFGDISNCKTRDELPEKAKKYLARIEEVVGVPIKFIGIGAGREDMSVEE